MGINIDIQGKTALVTGATGELGRVMARTLAQAGADIIIHYHTNSKKAEELLKEVNQLGRNAFLVSGDVGCEESVSQLRVQIEKNFRMPEIVVTNAVQQYSPWETILNESVENYTSQYRSCVMQNVLFAKAFIPYMQQTKWGRFIGINTECIMQMHPNQSAYISGKRGMDGLLRVLAKEVGSCNITVNQIAPGWTLSEKDQVTPPSNNSNYISTVPLGRRGTDQEVANVVAFIASNLSSFISGAYIPVCGGNVMPCV